MPLNPMPLPPLAAFAPLKAIMADLARLKADQRAVQGALAVLPTKLRQAEAERQKVYTQNLRAGSDVDPGDDPMRRLDDEKAALIRKRNALAGAVIAAEHDFDQYREDHRDELLAAVDGALAAARANAHADLNDFRTGWDQVDFLRQSKGLVLGAKSPRGLPVYLVGVTTDAVFDALSRALGHARAAESHAPND